MCRLPGFLRTYSQRSERHCRWIERRARAPKWLAWSGHRAWSGVSVDAPRNSGYHPQCESWRRPTKRPNGPSLKFSRRLSAPYGNYGYPSLQKGQKTARLAGQGVGLPGGGKAQEREVGSRERIPVASVAVSAARPYRVRPPTDAFGFRTRRRQRPPLTLPPRMRGHLPRAEWLPPPSAAIQSHWTAILRPDTISGRRTDRRPHRSVSPSAQCRGAAPLPARPRHDRTNGG